MFLSLIQMVEHRVNPTEVNWDLNQGVSIMESNKDLNIEIKLVLLPKAQQTSTNPSFPPRGEQHAHFNEGFNRRYSPPTFPSPGFNNTFTSDAVGRSIIQLAENQSHSLDFILARQQSQMDAYKEMTCSNQAREDDNLFAGIQVYDGEDPTHFEGWLDAVEQACNMTDRNLRKELMKKLTGAIRETLSMMNPYWTDDDVISKLRQDFSSMSTMNRAREELKDLKQLPSQLSVPTCTSMARSTSLPQETKHERRGTLLLSWSS